MTTYGTFNDPPLARGADIELAAADHARQYCDLVYCRKHGWCWFCGKRPAERVQAPLIPMCRVCEAKQEARNA